jgi:GTP-binding protein
MYLRAQFNDIQTPHKQIPPIQKVSSIAIVGRPNTGKTAIFNKITDSHNDGGVVHDSPGITRDRSYKVASWNGYTFKVIDTGGMVFEESEDVFARQITEQAMIAVAEASIVFFVVDGKEGITNLDMQLTQWIRRNVRVPTYVLVNKCESETVGYKQAEEFRSLGLGKPYPVSGIHGTGLSDVLVEATEKCLQPTTEDISLRDNCTNVAIIGRPNAGKSSLFNNFCCENRSIVSDIPGTTRDAIDQIIVRRDGNDRDLIREYRVIDTAGIRKQNKIGSDSVESFMIQRCYVQYMHSYFYSRLNMSSFIELSKQSIDVM